jgi:membrane protease subunit HflC
MNKSMRRLIIALSIIVILFIVILFLGPFYILNEGEQAVILRFGQIIRSDTEAGLHLKMPVVDQVQKYSRKIQRWNGDPGEIRTEGGEYIIVDTTARWRIVDPAVFYARLNTSSAAASKLDEIIDSAVRDIVSQNTLQSIIRDSNLINERRQQAAQDFAAGENEMSINSDAFDQEEFSRALAQASTSTSQPNIMQGRSSLSNQALESSKSLFEDFGIELIDLLVRHVRYSDDLIERVYDRMVSNRNAIAGFYRSYGEQKKLELLGQVENETLEIISEGYRQAETIRGQADAEAARIYSQAYALDPGFFEFWRAIESYRKTLPTFQKTMSTDMEYFDFLYSETGN